MLRARMLGGLRNKAARGELRIPLPAGPATPDPAPAGAAEREMSGGE